MQMYERFYLLLHSFLGHGVDCVDPPVFLLFLLSLGFLANVELDVS